MTEPRRASPPAATGGVLGDRGVCGTTAAVCGNGCGRRRLAGPSLLVGCARGGPASAALQRYAQARTGLTAHEFAAMFDVIRNDAYDAEAPDAARFGSTLDGWSDRILRDAALRPVLRVWLLGLLREARERAAAGVVPDGPTWAAMRAVGETAARRAPRREVAFAERGTVRLTDDRNGRQGERPGTLRIVHVRSARTLICPCCDGRIRIEAAGPQGRREILVVQPDQVAGSD